LIAEATLHLQFSLIYTSEKTQTINSKIREFQIIKKLTTMNKMTNLKSCFIACAIAGIAITNTAQAQWSLTGNAGTTPGTNFVGTTDNKAFYIKTNNSTRFAITSAGKVGIGITAPTAKFEIKGSGAAYDVVRFYNDKDATLDSSMIIKSNGNVGIGVSPAYKLDVAGEMNLTSLGYGYRQTVGTTSLGTYADTSAGWFGTFSNHPIWFFTNDGIVPQMVVQPSGNVGIGTAAPATKLEVNGDMTFSSGAARNITVAQPSTSGNGSSLTIAAANGMIGPSGGASGGSLTLKAGSAWETVSGGSGVGGDVKLISGGNLFTPQTQGGNIIFYTNNVNEAMRVNRWGFVSIGVSTPATGYLLTVGGKVICTELKVQAMPFPDYVFDKSYRLSPLAEVEQHINEFKRLPGMPGACEIEDKGMDVGSMQTKLVEKIEELTLYVIEQQKQIDALKKQVSSSQK
jgi:hypothetical protein